MFRLGRPKRVDGALKRSIWSRWPSLPPLWQTGDRQPSCITRPCQRRHLSIPRSKKGFQLKSNHCILHKYINPTAIHSACYVEAFIVFRLCVTAKEQLKYTMATCLFTYCVRQLDNSLGNICAHRMMLEDFAKGWGLIVDIAANWALCTMSGGSIYVTGW